MQTLVRYNKGLSIEIMKCGFGKFFKLGNNDSKKCFDKATDLGLIT